MKMLSTILFCLLAWQAPAEQSAKVTGHIITPKTVKDYAGLVLEIRLYEYDPLLADAPATLIGTFSKKNYAHKTGSETKTKFIIGDAAKIKPRRSYYLTCYVIDAKDNRMLMGKKKDKSFLCHVLTNGHPNKATLILKDLRKK